MTSRRIVLIRAINVGAATVPMQQLRDIAASLGATQVSTYIASGNLVCAVGDDPERFDRALESAIEQQFGFFREVISRSPDQWSQIIDAFPFDIHDESRCYVYPLTGVPDAAAVEALRSKDFGDDQWHTQGADLWIRYASGAATSKLTSATIARVLRMQGTGRNLRTARALLDRAVST